MGARKRTPSTSGTPRRVNLPARNPATPFDRRDGKVKYPATKNNTTIAKELRK